MPAPRPAVDSHRGCSRWAHRRAPAHRCRPHPEAGHREESQIQSLGWIPVTATLSAEESGPPSSEPSANGDQYPVASRPADPPMPTDRLFGWLGPLAVMLLAGVLRFDKLTQPAAIVN